MASLGHVVVGMAAARMTASGFARGRRPAVVMAAWSLLSLLPDADVIGLLLGISYHSPWGHRGATHSFAFAIALGSAIGGVWPAFGGSAFRTAALATLVLASHPILDALTNGGLGCALFWPFDQTRYFAPWNPIPVAPIGLDFLSLYGLRVATVELILFSPVLWFALWPRRAEKKP